MLCIVIIMSFEILITLIYKLKCKLEAETSSNLRKGLKIELERRNTSSNLFGSEKNIKRSPGLVRTLKGCFKG